MRRRNDAWLIASLLLKSEYEVAKARAEYEAKKHTTRRVLGKVIGCTPRSAQLDVEYEDRPNKEYLLSQLNDRLDGWRQLSGIAEVVPEEDRIVPITKLVRVRALRRRIRNGAIVPRVPQDLLERVA
jgi:hypothetical protein